MSSSVNGPFPINERPLFHPAGANCQLSPEDAEKVIMKYAWSDVAWQWGEWNYKGKAIRDEVIWDDPKRGVWSVFDLHTNHRGWGRLVLKSVGWITRADALDVARLCETPIDEERLAFYKMKYHKRSEISSAFKDGRLGQLVYFDGNEEVVVANFSDDDGENIVKPCRGNEYYRCHARVFQFLLDRGYAVPLYPWGKNAVQLGVAIYEKEPAGI